MTHPSGQDAPGSSSSELAGDEKYPLLVWVFWAVVLSVLGIALLVLCFGALTGYGWWPWDNDPVKHGRPELFEVTRSAVAAGALVAAAVAGAITIRRQRSTERSVRISADAQRVAAEAQRISARTYELETQRQEVEVVSRLRDRYTTAAGQLGHESPAIRLAGAYALATLADEWLARDEATARAEAQTCVDLLCAYMRTPRDTPTDTERAADLGVRQSIIRIITTHLHKDAHTSWSDISLDFTGAHFAGNYSFAGARFSDGKVSFDGARFSGGKVSFDQAEFSGGRVSFGKAEFSGGHVSLTGAKFSGGLVSFDEGEFSGGDVSFIGTKFSGGLVSFDRAKLSDGDVEFFWAEFSGGRVSFHGAEFSGGDVSFIESKFTGGDVPGPWPPGRPPEIWPIPVGRG